MDGITNGGLLLFPCSFMYNTDYCQKIAISCIFFLSLSTSTSLEYLIQSVRIIRIACSSMLFPHTFTVKSLWKTTFQFASTSRELSVWTGKNTCDALHLLNITRECRERERENVRNEFPFKVVLSSNKNHEHLWLVLIHVDDVYMCFRSSSNDTIWVSERKREKEKKWRKKCVFAKHRISRTEEHSAKTKSQQTIAHTHTHKKYAYVQEENKHSIYTISW